MIRIAICDDDSIIRQKLFTIMKSENEKNEYNVKIYQFQNGFDFCSRIEEGEYYDIVIMDIEYGAENGISIACKVREKYETAKIIFVTNHDNYIFQAVKISVEDYIVKTRIEEEFTKAYKKVLGKVDDEQTFEFYMDKKYIKILTKEILYFQSQGRVVFLFRKIPGGIEQYKMVQKLNEVERKLRESGKDNLFIRIHKSYLVNYAYVKICAYGYMELYTGEKLTISERNRNQVRNIVMELRGG